MRRAQPVASIALALGIALSGCQDGDPAVPDPDTTDAYEEQSLECAEDAKECTEDCFEAHGIDLEAIESCKAEIEACVEENSEDPAACIEVASACIGEEVTADAVALAECALACSGDFGDCVPEPPSTDPADVPPELEEIIECVTEQAGCLAGCAEGLGACELPTVNCDLSEFESLADCVAAAGGDLAAIQECLAQAGEVCEIPELDLGCFEAGQACFEECAAGIEGCL